MAVTRILSLVLRNTWHYVIIRYSYGELPKFVLRCSYEAALRKGVTTALMRKVLSFMECIVFPKYGTLKTCPNYIYLVWDLLRKKCVLNSNIELSSMGFKCPALPLWPALTFFEYTFWRAKVTVEVRAAIRPNISNESSVNVAIITPQIMGTSDK